MNYNEERTLRDVIINLWDEYCVESYSDQYEPYYAGFVYWFIGGLGWQFRSWICHKFGHGKLVDEGYGGPESGAIIIVCQRCGETITRQVLY